ncbi:FtsX-like permease family protein [Pseudothauera lacus]|uniref:ABC transporter permease n=1 Tax=Pseudothauera lacus TaxID=2136175 RepID=A0A2T4IH25_9RHOO|nr:FtsX-like permease family protein [Pseudothauera lacus]PTD97070.1 ABC transporter permease [Pseudothauera lacus]
MGGALRHVFIASLRRRRLATVLSLLAIALGVALGLAVQLIHNAALAEFERGVRILAGEADLQVSGARGGFDDALFLQLAAHPGVAEASPVVEVHAALPGREGSLRVLGVDVFRLAGVQPALLPAADGEAGMLAALAPGRIFLSPAAAAWLALEAGDALAVQSGVHEHTLTVSGSVPAAGAGQVLAVMDIAAAQQLFERIGVLTRVDLRLAEGASPVQLRRELTALLPAGVFVEVPQLALSEAATMSRAYRVNLSMLALIALLTGGFLVFSTQLLAVARRRQEFAFLRALGLPRGMLYRGLLLEGAVLGLAGGVLGALLGHVLAVLALRLVGGDLGAGYFDGMRPALHFDALLTLSFVALGVGAGLAGSWLPARSAATLPAARALRAGDDALLHMRPRWQGVVVCALGALLSAALPPFAGMPLGGYLAVACILATAVLLLPQATRLVMRLPGSPRALLWRLARARSHAAPGQAVVAAVGVLASVALASAMAIMVSSFRTSVDDWLTRMLPADLYVQASPSAASGFLDQDALRRIAALPGVAQVQPIRAEQVRLRSGGAPLTLLAREVGGGWGLPLVAGSLSTGEAELPPAWVSEAVVDVHGLATGALIELPLGGQWHAFRVAGVWRDYARQHGAVVIELETYRAISGDRRANDAALVVHPGVDVAVVATALADAFGENMLRVATPGEIRALSLRIFDRSFVVTYLMEAVAVLIGLCGVATTFAALATARRREFGMLRHLGLTRAQIGRLLALEGALATALGVAGGLLAGGAVAWVLVEVVNRQSFHWSMDISVPFAMLAVFAAALIVLAALAARIAGAQAMRQSAVQAVREDW